MEIYNLLDKMEFVEEVATLEYNEWADEKEKDRVFVTKGDNNDIEDTGFVHKDQIYGKVIFTIPELGKVLTYIQDKEGFIQSAILVIIIFILICMNDEKKNRRKMIRKKYEIKKEREKYN